MDSNLLMNMELGGVSTWTKSSSGGPPAPGQTEGSEPGGTGELGLAPMGSSEDQQLTGPDVGYSDQVESPQVVGRSRYLVQEEDDAFEAAPSNGSTAAVGKSGKALPKGWDSISLDSPK
jgi:hypothetical protein